MPSRIKRVPSIELALSSEAPPSGPAAPGGEPAGGECLPAASIEPAPDQREIAAVWRLLRHLGVSDSDADDATQQVFLVVAERHSDVEAGKRRAFVYGTALRVARAFSRLNARPMLELHEEAVPELDVPTPEELLDRRKAQRVLEELLSQMPFDLRAVFVLFEISDLPTTEIAEALGIPTGTVASRLRRAREDYTARVGRLRARMTRTGARR